MPPAGCVKVDQPHQFLMLIANGGHIQSAERRPGKGLAMIQQQYAPRIDLETRDGGPGNELAATKYDLLHPAHRTRTAPVATFSTRTTAARPQTTDPATGCDWPSRPPGPRSIRRAGSPAQIAAQCAKGQLVSCKTGRGSSNSVTISLRVVSSMRLFYVAESRRLYAAPETSAESVFNL